MPTRSHIKVGTESSMLRRSPPTRWWHFRCLRSHKKAQESQVFNGRTHDEEKHCCISSGNAAGWDRLRAGCKNSDRQRDESDGIAEDCRILRFGIRLRNRTKCESKLTLAEVRGQDIQTNHELRNTGLQNGTDSPAGRKSSARRWAAAGRG